ANGVATFGGLSIDRAGAGYTLGASAAGLFPATSGAFTVTNPVPALAGLSPSAASAGGPAFTLNVTGTGFLSGSVVLWGGPPRPTGLVGGDALSAAFGRADIAASGTVAVTVANPGPGGGGSNALSFVVNAPTPTPTSTPTPTATATAGVAPRAY